MTRRIGLKKVSQQVIVITGATSGIGLVTARLAAQRGARLVLASRNAEALQQLVSELAERGGRSVAVTADVGDEAQVRRIAEVALERFGGFDTWVNNAGVAIFGRAEDVALADQRRLFDTNFWGVVHGSLIATRHLKARGGAVINVGGQSSEIAMPLQAIYSASKHAVKGFTDALRLELEAERAPVSLSLILPAAVDTMLARHARNYMETAPRLPSRLYAPEVVARAILHAAAHPVRNLYVGSSARFGIASSRLMPRISDWLRRRSTVSQQRDGRPAGDRSKHALYTSRRDLIEREGVPGIVHEHSLYTRAAMYPKTSFALGAVLVVGALWALAFGPRRT